MVVTPTLTYQGGGNKGFPVSGFIETQRYSSSRFKLARRNLGFQENHREGGWAKDTSFRSNRGLAASEAWILPTGSSLRLDYFPPAGRLSSSFWTASRSLNLLLLSRAFWRTARAAAVSPSLASHHPK